MNARMERITRQALGRWLRHRDGEDIHQEARIAYWQSEDDDDALLVVKVRRRAIDAWRRMTKREQPVADVPERGTTDPDIFDAAGIGLPPRWTYWAHSVAVGAIDGDDATADSVRIYVEEANLDLEDGWQ